MPDAITRDTSGRVSTADIFDVLRERICLLDYPPGTVLREADLAAEFGVSRTPIRAVLQRLGHAGLIESRDGVGTLVTDLDFEQIRDIYQMRIRIAELIGVLDANPLGQSEAEIVAGLKERADALLVRFDIADYWRINHDLHTLIAGVIGNQALRGMWDHFYFLSARIWYRHARADSAGVAVSLMAEIDEVARAIAENDAVALGYVQRNHIAYGLSRLEAGWR